jgi:citrate lyase subunit beta/citryl-CoA lyase
MLAGAPRLEADQFVIDLEDAVAPASKDEARDRVAAALTVEVWDRLAVAVRVNAPRTPWCHLDVCVLASMVSQPRAIVVPKVESAGDLEFIDRLLDGAEARAGRRTAVRTHALIETSAGLAKVQEIAASSPRLEALILGYADLAASLGRSQAGQRDLDNWRPAQDAVLVAARSNGLQAIDGPYLGVGVDAAFMASVDRARDLGFDGKWAIHPKQLASLNDAFTPTAEEVEAAREVAAVLARAERDDQAGAVEHKGQMLDEAVRLAALRTLRRAGETV